ncbi:MAG: ATP-binding protein [Clostridiales bacterium]|nr:ATP-binding protein [Clostridiales bacterium]
MAYSESVYERAKKELEKRRATAQAERDLRHSNLILNHPEIVELEKQMANASLELIRSAAQGKKVEIQRLKQQSLDAQAKRREIVVSEGYPEDYLDIPYSCKKCEDTGFIDGRMCDCFEKTLKAISYADLCKISPVKKSGFEDFKIELYPSDLDEHGVSPRKQMNDIATYCINYANDFSLSSPSLLFSGKTGLGKTHLSLAIADKVIDKGYNLIYGSAQNLLNKVENEHFGRGDSKTETLDKMLDCDLLILDDLGAEFSTQFTVATIYNIINSRMLTSLPTIISTNLNPQELEDRYTERVTSRIISSYIPLMFCGKDIRQIKKNI